MIFQWNEKFEIIQTDLNFDLKIICLIRFSRRVKWNES